MGSVGYFSALMVETNSIFEMLQYPGDGDEVSK